MFEFNNFETMANWPQIFEALTLIYKTEAYSWIIRRFMIVDTGRKHGTMSQKKTYQLNN
jgi:hypothetical protein